MDGIYKSYPTVVIGAGAAGLVIAIGLAKAGKKVLLIERDKYGGDCTNTGCIPSKTLIHAANQAHALRTAENVGLKINNSDINTDGCLQHVREIVQSIRNHEEPPILAKYGVDCLSGKARFIDKNTLKVNLSNGNIVNVNAENIVIATGSHPYIPPIPGLEDVKYRTNEDIFSLTEIPRRLAIIGGGPIGVEMAQAFNRLGTQVTIVEFSPQVFSRHDDEVQTLMSDVLQKEGIEILANHETKAVSYHVNQIKLELYDHRQEQTRYLEVPELLVAVGRRPNLDSLQLENAGVKYNNFGILIDDYGRTSRANIWAAGDITGNPMFTHIAEYQGRQVLTNLLSPWPLRFKRDKQALSTVTYTDPEVATVGLSEAQARNQYSSRQLAIYHVNFSDVDRAIVSGEKGFVKIITKKWSSKILGATIVGQRAGEMINEISLAMYQGTPLRQLAKLVHPYPTYNLAIRKAADQWLTQTVLTLVRNPRQALFADK